MRHSLLFLLVLGALVPSISFPQAENVPARHRVYDFLKRMEVKQIIERYHDAAIPLSRRDVARFLLAARANEAVLTRTERAILEDLVTEFQYEITGSVDSAYRLIDSKEPAPLTGFLSDKEKFIYAYTDSNLSSFVEGLLILDIRRSTGDALGGANAGFIQFGARIRGTVFGHLGYYIQGTNAQFYGERNVLRRDRIISQAYTLDVLDAKNFDFVEGYVRYDADILSIQFGRERLLWGNGYGDQLIVSDNVRVFDFIRADAQYKALTYTFVHAWLIGNSSVVRYSLPPDTSFVFSEPVNADKYLAAHRFGFSFPRLFDIGFQEMVIYSNRSPDLAFLNPLTLFESAQRSRQERDNVFWAIDLQTHVRRDVQLSATVLFDDINFPKWGTNSVQNKFAYQIGALVVDPFGLEDIALAAEYTRVEPYTFSHSRSRDNDYGSLGRILGHHIGPNADSWFFRADYLWSRRFVSSLRIELQREGENVYDPSTGMLVENVGGNFLEPHRAGRDSETKNFLGGNLIRTLRVEAFATYEVVNEVFVDLRYSYASRKDYSVATETRDHDFGVALRVDF